MQLGFHSNCSGNRFVILFDISRPQSQGLSDKYWTLHYFARLHTNTAETGYG